MVLKTKAEKGPSSLGSRVSTSPVFGFFPWTAPLSNGEREAEDHQVQEGLNPHVPGGGTAGGGNDLLSIGPFSETLKDLFRGDLSGLQIFLHQLVIHFDDGFNHLFTQPVDLFLHLRRNLLLLKLSASILFDRRRPFDGSDQPHPEISFLPDRTLDRNRRLGRKGLFHFLDDPQEIGALRIHLADVKDSRNFKVIRISPYRLGLDLNPGIGSDDDDGAIHHPCRRLGLRNEVCVPGSIDEMKLMLIPFEVGKGGSDAESFD